MQHTRQSRLTLLSGLAFSMPAMLAGVANASDAAITLDRVERSVQVVTDFTTKSDSNNELTNEEWHGHAQANLGRSGIAFAEQFFTVSTDRIEGEMRVMSNMSRRLDEASSSLQVAFTVSRSDYSLPDSSWGWSGDSALESLYGDAKAFGEIPACRMTLQGMLAYEAVAPSTNFPVNAKARPGFGSHFGRSRGAMGFSLTRNGKQYERQLLSPFGRHGEEQIDMVLELEPGEYVLSVDCGLLENPYRPGRPVLGEVIVQLGIGFEALQPGSAEPFSSGVSGYWDQSNGTLGDWWTHRRDVDEMTDPEVLDFDEERWYRHAMPFDNEYFDGGAVYAIDPTYWHGFVFSRTEKEVASTDTNPTRSDVDITLTMELDETTDVGIATLCAFMNESGTTDANEGRCGIRIYSLDESNTVWDQSWQADPDKSANTRQFIESQDWITLEPGRYRIFIKNESTSNDIDDEDTGNESGFWYALAFETP